jgi:alpha-tubulin suppressor-like RCC1 family protein
MTMRLLRICAVAGLFSVGLMDAARGEDVSWVNPVGVSIAGSTLTKTGGTAGWNAGAASQQLVRDGYGYVQFTTGGQANTSRACGLSVGDPGQTLTEIDYAIHLQANGTVVAYKLGAQIGGALTYDGDDVFRVEVRHGVVQYIKNGAAWITSALPTHPLRVDAALNTPGAVLADVKVGSVLWTTSTGMSVSNGSLSKTGAAGWNAGAFSANFITRGDGFVEFTAGQNNTSRIAGLGANNPAQVPQALADIEYGIHLRADGLVTVREAGVSQGDFGGYLGTDRFRVEVRGNTVRYVKNGAEFLSHTFTPTYALRMEAAFETTGASLHDLMVEEFLWTNEVGVAVVGSTLVNTAPPGIATSSRTFASGDAWMEFTSLETTTRRAAGFNSGSQAQSLSDIDFAIELTETGGVRVVESGVVRWNSGTYAHGDRFRVEVREGVVRYLRNDDLLWSTVGSITYPLRSDAVLNTSGATLAYAAEGDVVWTNVVGTQARGSVLRKLTGAAAYDAGAVSTRALTSGFIEVTAGDFNSTRFFGLSHGDMSTQYQDIDYAIRLTGPSSGSATVFEKGVGSASQSFVPGDRFRIEVVGGQVSYSKNGAAPFRTTPALELPVRADTSFGEVGSNVLGIVLSGSAVQDQLEAPTFSPVQGTYTTTQSVAITAYPGSTIRYTVDGTTPNTLSPQYTGPVPVNVSLTLKAKAWKTGFLESPVGTANYVLQVATPQITPGTATYTTPQLATITCSTAGAVIHYTTTGLEPTESDPVILSGGTVLVDVTRTVKAKAWKVNWSPSVTASVTYTLKVATPTLNPPGGSFTSPTNVQVSTTSPGATLHYTTNGAEPTTSDPTVASGGTVLIASSTMLKVKGVRAGWVDSTVGAGAYFLSLGPVAAPTMTPPGGVYGQAQSVTLFTTTAGALIRYTLDGTEPGFTSAIYAAPLAIEASTTVKAKAFRADWTPSTTTNGAYLINTGAVDAPSLSPGSGTYATHQGVAVTCSTPGATIHYTINGQIPTESDPVVASGAQIDVPRTLRLRARAFKNGMDPSMVRTADYRLVGAAVAGEDNAFGLKADGTLWAWGNSFAGNLGTGSNTDHFTPTQVSQTTGLLDAIAIAAGGAHTVAIDKQGQLWGWGAAGPNGSTADRWVPTLIAGTSGFVSVAAGHYFSVGLKADGTVWAWGSMSGINYGPQPVSITGLVGVSAIAAGYEHAIALKTDGMAWGPLWAWGNNFEGQLGDGTQTNRTTPVRVAALSDVVGAGCGLRHTLAVTSSEALLAWGSNALGTLGDGTTGGPRLYPAAVPGISAVFADGFSHSLAVGADGRAYGWGWNGNGQIGNGIYDGSGIQARPSPDLVAAGNLRSATAGVYHSIALRNDGTVWAWGSNSDGRLGVGSSVTNTAIPLQVPLQVVDNSWLGDDADGDGLSNAAEIAHGTDPMDADTNDDGILDGAAVSSGISATDLDMDDDGIANGRERQNGTDPFLADTDGDGVSDKADAFPLDPTRWALPPPIPGDVTPPVIQLLEPKNAVPVP